VLLVATSALGLLVFKLPKHAPQPAEELSGAGDAVPTATLALETVSH
jgi:hypothetical protein